MIGKTFVRLLGALVCLTVVAAGWDAEMIEYPAVIAVGERLHLFYNGNAFGRNGIGVAVAE